MVLGDHSGPLRLVAFSDYRAQDIELFIDELSKLQPRPELILYAGDDIERFRPPNGKNLFEVRHPKPKSAVGDWQRSLKRLLILAGVPDGHAHRFRDTFSVELLLAGVPIERVSILLGHQSVRITGKHYSPWVRARQEQLEADVRRIWETPESQRRVHGGYTEQRAPVIPLISRRKNGGGGGSRTPVRKALRLEAYMLIPFSSLFRRWS